MATLGNRIEGNTRHVRRLTNRFLAYRTIPSVNDYNKVGGSTHNTKCGKDANDDDGDDDDDEEDDHDGGDAPVSRQLEGAYR